MTADHWIQLAIGMINAAAAFAAGRWGAAMASRINQPTPKEETIPPAKTRGSRVGKVLKSSWFFPGILILVDIYALQFFLRHYSLSNGLVLLISGLVAVIVASAGFVLFVELAQIVRQLIDSHSRLLGIVKDVYLELKPEE